MNAVQATVLAVDDNATIRKAISMRLTAKGYRVITASSGSAALRHLNRSSFDLILLDLQMPGIAGDEVLRRVRRRYSATEMPVIMLAASSDKADINRTLALGANDYIVKPGDLPVLVARIRTQLALKATVARLRSHNDMLRRDYSLASANGAAIEPALAAETEAMLNGIDKAHHVPFDVLHDNTPVTCFTVNEHGTIRYTNQFGARYLGFTPAALIDRSIFDLYAADDHNLAQENFAGAVESPGRVHRWDIRHIKNNGTTIWMRNTARAVRYGEEIMILVTCEDIDDTYKLSELLTFQSRHDDLTGLVNRKALEQRLGQVIDSAHSEHTEHALAIINLDQFKLINDTCGHDAGDELLREIAHALKTSLRKRDTLARIGGDEFAVLLEDCVITQAYAASETLRTAIETHDFVWQERHYKLSASIGVVPISHTCESAGAALSMADTACYAAKDSGRNRVHTYEPDNVPVVLRHGEMRWANRINEALDDDRFVLCYQTIKPLEPERGQGAHYEILVRMQDEAGTVIMPGEFLPAAERYNLTAKLDRWIIGKVFDWLAARPLDINAIDLCCINLSGQSIGNKQVLEYIFDQLARAVVPSGKICFEITETAAIADLFQATRFIEQLREHGCRFALDDFGSGFSSLAYLKQLPVDYLKIDGSFVRDMVTDSIDCAMVRSINNIGHVMGKKTIAEFVENRATLDLLRSIGVDYAQGYEINSPAALDEIILLR